MNGKFLKPTESKTASVFFVGGKPSRSDFVLGAPFTGESGQFLTRALEIISASGNISLDRVFLTTCVRKNQKISIGLLREDFPTLEKEIETLKPEVIILLGSTPLQIFKEHCEGIKTARTDSNRLSVFDFNGTPVVVTYSPEEVSTRKSLTREFLEDLNDYLVNRIWEVQTSQHEYTVELVNDPARADEVLRTFEGAPAFGFDIETVSLELGSPVLTCAFYIPGSSKAYVIPIDHPESRLDSSKYLEWVKRIALYQPGATVIGQNIAFDLSRLLYGEEEVPKVKIEDSKIYHHQYSEEIRVRNLDFLTRKFTDLGTYKTEVDTSKLQSTGLSKVAKYNGLDSISPILIIKNLTNRLKEDGYYSSKVIDLYGHIVPYISMMESSGFKVDRKILYDTLGDFELQRDTKAQELKEVFPGVNLESPQQLSRHLYGTLNLPVPDIKDVVGKSGMVSTREDVLKHLDHPAVEKLLEFRGLNKKISFINGTRGNSIIENLTTLGFVHPTYYPIKDEYGGTVTGRLSAKQIAIQTIPYGSIIRRPFVSRYPDGRLLEIDGAQMELRVGALESQDKTLLQVFRDKLDPHQATADLCGTSRKIAKNINFGAVYKISIKGLIEKMGLSPAMAKSTYHTLNKQWEGLYAFMDSIQESAVRNKEVRTSYGRVRRVPYAGDPNPRGWAQLREAANFILQATASDIVQLLGWKLMMNLDGLAVPVASIHDGLVFDYRHQDHAVVLDKVRTSVLELRPLVNQVLGLDLSLPFKFDVKIGENWLETKPIEDEFYTST